MNEAMREAVAEANAAGFEVQMIDIGDPGDGQRHEVPMLPLEGKSFEYVRAAIRWLGTARCVSGGRMFAEGIVLEPPRPAAAERRGFPYDEPEVMKRYGIEEP